MTRHHKCSLITAQFTNRHMAAATSVHDRGVRLVALLEAAKGAVVLVAGFGILEALHVGAARLCDELAGHMHLNLAKGTPRVFADLAADTSNKQLQLLAAAAFAYVAIRAIEAYGLWNRRRGAEWFSVASGLVYVPFELVELARGASALKVALLVANLALVAYMASVLRAQHRQGGGAVS
jgi:uncharacterized membrane protein (DUF2068 family)